MNDNKYDVAIIGAGPVGGFIANEVSKNGFDVAIFEKNKEIGRPLKCAGLVSERVFDILDFSKEKVVENEIKGAHIHSPSGDVLTIGGDRTRAYLIDRIAFDKIIVGDAIDNGAEVFLGSKANKIMKKKDIVEVENYNELRIKSKILIGADGPYSFVRKKFGLSQPEEILIGIGAEMTDTDLDPDFAEIFIGNEIAPGFFAWMIPTNLNGSEARVGLCTKPEAENPSKHYFSRFLDKCKKLSFFKDVNITRKIAGVIPLGPPKKACLSNVLIVGDAASQVKPFSGGGLYPGLLGGKYCSSAVISSLQKKVFSAKFLGEYYKSWNEQVGREIRRGLKFRRIFKSLSDRQLNNCIDKLRKPELVEIINEHGDIDYPSKLAKPVLKKAPSLLKFLPNLL